MKGFVLVHEDGSNTPRVLALSEIADVRTQYVTGKAFICLKRNDEITPLLTESVAKIAALIEEAEA